ncbi:hypothetical protein QQ008_14995 [Fulvivirgaceae bacterium BMA10]|uniref:Uncharacterized protein n=1 Tax=Splendidivirga corallicola TaxID=3051826 RepID=A0ABT8KR66_9BACT|nr:hypothetical protein [Fulvivirgaceae bacterium BMA10]
MEKSIEIIWKEGFLNKDALVAPKLNDLYNQKSKHIIDKYMRMFKINLVAIVVGSLILLPGSFLIGMPYMGVPMFFILNAMVIVDKRLLGELKEIDNNITSYEYLKTFDKWIKRKIIVNTRMARILYPYTFIAILMGFWFINEDGNRLGETIVTKLIENYPDIYLIFGIPLTGIIGALMIIGILTFFGGRIYRWDMNLVYGRVLRKLEEIISDMEELRS